jgi:hypothetical protein
MIDRKFKKPFCLIVFWNVDNRNTYLPEHYGLHQVGGFVNKFCANCTIVLWMDSVILVFGGTGKQGAGVVEGLLSLPSRPFTVRVLTRDPSSEKVKQLQRSCGANIQFVGGNTSKAQAGEELSSNQSAGVLQVIAGDVEDERALEEAMQGVKGVFCNLDFWQLGAQREVAAGKRK